jgi:hypothetical protein
MKTLTLILFFFIFSNLDSKQGSKDINIYYSFPGNFYSLQFNIEYNIIDYKILGIQNTTYLKYGSSMIGFQGFGVLYNYPIIGFTHFLGTTEGFEIGANYFRMRATGSYNNEKGEPHNRKNDQLLGFEIGYREYYNKHLMIRYTFKPFYSLDRPENNLNIFKSFYLLLSFSVGYSF